MTGPDALLWSVFGVAGLGTLGLDLGIFHRGIHEVSGGEAMLRSVLWVTIALAFGSLVILERGLHPGLDYLTAYVVELSLSVDNIFVFIVIFASFKVPGAYQHKVLFWGVLSAVVLRALFIGMGVAAVQRLHWLTYVLGGILVFTSIRLATGQKAEFDPAKNRAVALTLRLLRFTEDFREGRFFVLRRATSYATPLFLVLVAIETTDLIFAVDSVPAVLAITTDPLLAYTSNMFAVAGLRSLYFALASILPRFRYLHYGLALVLALIGVKMLMAELYRPPVLLTLGLVLLILATSILLSLLGRSPAARRE